MKAEDLYSVEGRHVLLKSAQRNKFFLMYFMFSDSCFCDPPCYLQNLGLAVSLFFIFYIDVVSYLRSGIKA